MGRNETLERQAVRYLAEDMLARTNEYIRQKGADIRYELNENDDGTFNVRVGRRYIGADGYFRYKCLNIVLCDVDVFSAYYCSLGIAHATMIDYQ